MALLPRHVLPNRCAILFALLAADDANGREANSPEQAAEWATCDETAKTAVYRHGFVFAGNADYAVTPQLKAVRAACPSMYSDVPLTGIWALAFR